MRFGRYAGTVESPDAQGAAQPGAAVHVARQPILDADGATFAYELLFRDAATAVHAAEAGDRATSQVILDTHLEFGLDRLVGDRCAFVNATRAFLVGDLPVTLPPDRTVLEVLETVPIDAAVVDGVRRLRAEGFRIALDDYEDDAPAGTLLREGLVDFVKLDVLGVPAEVLRERVERLRPSGAALLAERVATPELVATCRELGFDLFQGYALGVPETATTSSLSPTRASSLNLLAELTREDASVDDVVALVECDVALSYRVVRAANSASAGLPRAVSSVRDALVLLGLDRLRAWVVLMSLSDEGSAPSESLRAALARARFCELLVASGASGSAASASTAFMTGMLSTLDVLLGCPLDVALERLPLEEAVRAALLRREGGLGGVLDAVVAYERGDLTHAASLMRQSYLSALAWADSVCQLALAV